MLETYEPTTITHRRIQSRFLEPIPEDEEVDAAIPKVGRAAANLCRLAFELAKSPDIITLSNTALDGLFEGNAGRRRGGAFASPRHLGERRRRTIWS